MNENHVGDIWMLFKEYLDKKTIELAAERYIDLLADCGVSDKVIQAASGIDDSLDDAISYYLDEEPDEDEYDEDNWDYDNED